ncbi:MAG: CoA ester lyase [Betaproteobacteria bacterium]
MSAPAPLWRSMMFVPATSDKFIAGAAKRGADAVMLDLEDSIPPEEKQLARTKVASASKLVGSGGSDVLVRVNQPLKLIGDDLAAVVSEQICAIVLPKTLGAQHVALVSDLLDELEQARGLAPRHTKIVAMIETADALFRMEEIAACERVVGITVGAEDLAVSMRMKVTPDSLYVPNVLAVAAARAAGKMPIGYVGTVADIDDLDQYRATIKRARALGFAGGFCVHPSQVAILNAEFAPSPAEVEDASGLVAAFEAALAQRSGAVRYKGKMIDLPVVERARDVLRLQARVEDRKA